MKFEGCYTDLETVVAGLGRQITSSTNKGSMHQIKTGDGVTLNLFGTGTLQVQGKADLKAKFEQDFDHYVNGTQSEPTPVSQVTTASVPQPMSNGKTKEVFIVHGHDTTSREQLELVLHKLGLDPFVLGNTGGQGLTIIEALESKIGKNSKDTSFGIVLMTPDDQGYAESDGPDKIQPRARQNVVLEMGMLISSIGRKNMAILVKGHLEKPSDADGILYIPFNNHVKETVPRLANRLKDSGFILSPDKIAHASS
ncbi:nucleotide-binding protein [Vibrio vulnificus]|uniref:nucleotide-binding protein n=1 Tax=Vibrio vulnificus TaxID=672 RepID=UPI001A339CB3|nr:nucleotide-binding protein [Vibrio vulnificus]EGQ8682024.1 DNA-binding protein [Vibrio parahaemolyticus]EGQ8700463.1 DNA-binding protein [Vibrio parahaemolyticus]EGQ8754658.1 DNA-binding protein [Vibrio parahaemolyticus]EGQ8759240.1 DNA-binding protein [Vibrio parahaemolyticus]EGQ8773979.1 DNA-binding protein [Vibrio parahaemolyticus]